MFRNILFFFSILLCSSSAAQTNLDSLWGVWNNESQADTVRLKAMHRIVWKDYLFNQPDSAFYFAQMQYDFANSKNLKSEMATALNTQGASFHVRGDYDKAIDYYTKSLKISEETGGKQGIALSLNNIGIIYKGQGDYVRAIDFYTKSLRIKEGIGDKRGIALSLNNIGNIYMTQGNYAKAINYHSKSLKIKEEIGNKQGIAASLNNIGDIYTNQGDYVKAIDYYVKSLKIEEALGNKKGIAASLNNIGNIYMNQGDHTKAVDYFTNGLSIREDIGDKQGIAASLINIGNVFTNQGDYSKAIDSYTKSLAIQEEIGDKQGIANSLSSIGNIYSQQASEAQSRTESRELYTKALDYSSRSLTLAQEVGAATETKEASNSLWNTYKNLGNYQQSLAMYELYIATRDSMQSEENQRGVLRQEYKYEYEKEALTDSLEFAKKEAVLTERTEKQQLGLIAVGGGLLLVVTLAFAIYSGKKKSDELLLNILPEETAKELKQKGYADARQFDEVSVLFTDFKGFTAMAEQLSPKNLVQDIHVCFSEFDRIMEKYGIEKIKTIGDAYMAACGLPSPNPDHAQNVIKAGFEMRDFVEAGKAAKIEKGLPFFEIRIGIHTGSVVAGIVGIKKFAYDIWGDTVNTASRMESSGEVGKVNISETTYQLVKDQFTCEYRG
ncbi:MAG: tetratricopeptide repeat protein, partial [Flavobacteriales bacterium]|nr:tetratricopeptide repeat protein [Flavobacteriales bacterium]